MAHENKCNYLFEASVGGGIPIIRPLNYSLTAEKIDAITGILNPVVGALVHNAGSVLVIVNSSLLLKWRKRP